jgi:hypothetical protein
MANPFGNPTGPIYPMGKITVVTPGTAVQLSTTPSLGANVTSGGNVKSTTGFGTPTTGIPSLTNAGLPAQAVFNGFLLTTSAANNGLTYLVFLGSASQPGGIGAPNSVILALPPNTFFSFFLPNLVSVLMPGQFGIDGDTPGNSIWVTGVGS